MEIQPNIWGLLNEKIDKSGLSTEELLKEADEGWED